MHGGSRTNHGRGTVAQWRRIRSNCPSMTCSPRVPSAPMSDLGRYGEIAARHMARWQPSTFAAIPAEEREAYFRRVDDEVGQTIRDREHCLTPPPSLQQTDHLAYVGQLQMTHHLVEAEVLAELVYLPPEPGLESEADEPETDQDGAYIDRGWNPPRLGLTDQEWAEQQRAEDWQPLPPQQ